MGLPLSVTAAVRSTDIFELSSDGLLAIDWGVSVPENFDTSNAES
jgi:hypothetical protein